MALNRVAIVLLVVALFFGCSRRLPSTITANEYAVYADWLASWEQNPEQQRFSHDVLIQAHTFPLRPLFDRYDKDTNSRCRQASNNLLDELLSLGDAEFRLGRPPSESIRSSVKYRLIDTYPHDPSRSFVVIQFSRVAFSQSGQEAFFGVGWDRCYIVERAGKQVSMCGDAQRYYLRAVRQADAWHFQHVDGCPLSIA